MALQYQFDSVHLGRLICTVSLGLWEILLDSSCFDIVHSMNSNVSPDQST